MVWLDFEGVGFCVRDLVLGPGCVFASSAGVVSGFGGA